MEQAEENWRVVRDRYRNGEGTNTEVLDAEVLRSQSRSNFDNADFDGDEMNVHALQSEEAQVEASMLMEAKNNIISPRFGGPLVGLDLDHVSGIYVLTQKETELTREETAELFSRAAIEIDLPETHSLRPGMMRGASFNHGDAEHSTLISSSRSKVSSMRPGMLRGTSWQRKGRYRDPRRRRFRCRFRYGF